MIVHTETDDLQRLVRILPDHLQAAVRPLPGEHLVEIVLDLGRPPRRDSSTGR